MKCLITGAAGFIGYHLSLSLLKKKIIVYGVDNLNNYYSPKLKQDRLKILKKNKNFYFNKIDLKNFKTSLNLISKIKPDVVFHLASQPGIMYSFTNPKTYTENNSFVTTNLIKICNKTMPKKFYYSSTSSAYGNQKKYPINENAKLKPLNHYAKTKIKSEEFLKKKLNKKIDLKIFRLFTVYGPYSRPDMLFISYLNSVFKKNKYTLYNNGKYQRDFSYVKDVVKILISFIKINKLKQNIFNISSAKPITINKIIKIIHKYIKSKPNIIFKPKRNGEMLITHGDNRLLKKIIKIKKFTPIELGIKSTIKWYLNYKNKSTLNFLLPKK